uniref:Uncharacterized protein n=1 Tax=uncultured bacterium W5-77b TaxID=1131000 RepID=H9BWG1_9BACT|nr:hypothetical protein [uncultured bacterium W5-77b]
MFYFKKGFIMNGNTGINSATPAPTGGTDNVSSLQTDSLSGKEAKKKELDAKVIISFIDEQCGVKLEASQIGSVEDVITIEDESSSLKNQQLDEDFAIVIENARQGGKKSQLGHEQRKNDMAQVIKQVSTDPTGKAKVSKIHGKRRKGKDSSLTISLEKNPTVFVGKRRPLKSIAGLNLADPCTDRDDTINPNRRYIYANTWYEKNKSKPSPGHPDGRDIYTVSATIQKPPGYLVFENRTKPGEIQIVMKDKDGKSKEVSPNDMFGPKRGSDWQIARNKDGTFSVYGTKVVRQLFQPFIGNEHNAIRMIGVLVEDLHAKRLQITDEGDFDKFFNDGPSFVICLNKFAMGVFLEARDTASFKQGDLYNRKLLRSDGSKRGPWYKKSDLYQADQGRRGISEYSKIIKDADIKGLDESKRRCKAELRELNAQIKKLERQKSKRKKEQQTLTDEDVKKLEELKANLIEKEGELSQLKDKDPRNKIDPRDYAAELYEPLDPPPPTTFMEKLKNLKGKLFPKVLPPDHTMGEFLDNLEYYDKHWEPKDGIKPESTPKTPSEVKIEEEATDPPSEAKVEDE